MSTQNKDLHNWIQEVAALTKPDKIHWCTGSEEENNDLVQLMLKEKTLHKLNNNNFENCYLHRSDPNDVARTEHLTYVCSEKR